MDRHTTSNTFRFPPDLEKEVKELHKKFEAKVGIKVTRTAIIVKLIRIGLDNFYMPTD